MIITDTTTVGDIAAAIPASVKVFQRHGIDFCCGGKRSLNAICAEQGLSFDAIAASIASAAAEQPTAQRDWTDAPLHDLVEHIVTTYHDTLRQELPRIEGMAIRVSRVHGAKDLIVGRLERAIHELSAALIAHMQKEEMILFPSICAREQGGTSMPLAQPIQVMEAEHDHAGELLAEMRLWTDGYTVPAWGCATVRALYHALAELESAMHVHVHLENNVLFPRATALGAAA
jgi:regulator of cell morphogenesis and NO signaling